MDRLRNKLMCALFAVFIAGPLLIAGASNAKVELPSWFTAEDAVLLSGEINTGDIPGNLSIRGFARGKLQKATERAIGNCIPCKASAMLGNALLQRNAIAASNALFGWECYPTYFGSTRLHIPEVDATTFLPDSPSKKERKDYEKRLKAFAEGIREAAARHPDKRFVVYLVQGYETPSFNPAYALVTNPMTAQDPIAMLSDTMAGQDNLFFCTDTYESAQEYYTDFYRSDHHWTYLGAERAYNTLAHELGLEPFVSPGEVNFGDFRFMGAIARAGLDSVEDVVHDTSHDFSYLTVKIPGGKTAPYGHDAFNKLDDRQKRYNFYGEYFNYMPTGSMITNDRAKSSAVLVSDSYRGGIEHYLAERYATTYTSAHLHENSNESQLTEKSRLEDLPGFNEANDVYFIACAQDFARLPKKCPDYFAKR